MNHFSPSLKEFLPKEYIKQRGAEKKIFQVWSHCSLDKAIIVLISAYLTIVYELLIYARIYV